MGGPAVDVLLAATAIGFAVAVFAFADDLGRPSVWLLLGSILAGSACAAAVPRHPVIATVIACPVLAVAASTSQSGTADTASVGVLAIIFLLIYRLGSTVDPWPGLGLATAVAVTLQVVSPPFNPIYFAVTLGPLLVGAAVRARGQAQSELEQRGRELAFEQQRQAEESVRYERARIARELHDIVAHSVTVMVVQAGAGQYLSGTDPVAAAEALDAITEQAERAGSEVTRLFALLEPGGTETGRLDDLVRGAAAAGLDVRPVPHEQTTGLSERASAAAFQLVREALTNAIKHAPGSTVEIALDSGPDGVEVVVTNGPARIGGVGLTAAGGGHGIVGMRERLQGWDSRLSSGPTPDGGWQVRALLPGPR